MPKTAAASLTGVPETMLWTLHNRASEAMRRDGVLDDPKAVEIYRSIDYDYRRSFGRANPSHALRSVAFDLEVESFLTKHPDGVVVNLGEGLETQRFRVRSPRNLWLTVDLPEAIEARERFIEPDDQHVHLAVSALDRAWIPAVPRDRPTILTAQGLFMYFREEEVRALLQDIAERVDRFTLVFDVIPRWLSRKTLSRRGLRMTRHYRTPDMPWGLDCDDVRSTFERWLGSGVAAEEVQFPSFPRGPVRYLSKLVMSTPVLRKRLPTIVKLRSERPRRRHPTRRSAA
ncbi:MAG: class I SAM-dependent methyltransferase [Acidobacteriota bacterium]